MVISQGPDVAIIEEVMTEATVEALNAALALHGIAPERIVAVHHLDGDYIANGPGPRFRVLFRT